MFVDRSAPGDRVRAAVPALLIHALLAFALVRGLAGSPAELEQDRLRLIDLPPEQKVEPEPPPPPPPATGAAEKVRQADPRPEGAASPPNLVSQATPIVAPEPIVPPPLPTPKPLPAAPVAGTGFAPSAGAAPIRGPGTGSGGVGSGTGSGSGGGGAGGGGGGGGGGAGPGVTPPRQIAGRLSIDDMPEALRETGFRGTVAVIYRSDPDGRARNCRVTRSSGSRALDQATCRLIEQRWRLRPSRDAVGRPTSGYVEEDHHFEAEMLAPEPRRERRRGW